MFLSAVIFSLLERSIAAMTVSIVFLSIRPGTRVLVLSASSDVFSGEDGIVCCLFFQWQFCEGP